jgi:uncharacterized protein YdiU (UPF0061 family)
MHKSFGLVFRNLFATLPKDFYTRMTAEKLAKTPKIVHLNQSMADEIGLDPNALQDPDFSACFSGQKNLLGSAPLATVYAGHQFGVWAGQLGDGRALLLGQVQGKTTPVWDIQLKGSGKTPYSRMGDGRAVLRSCIREYLCAEAMHALGIPTTRSLGLLATHEIVAREKYEPGAILIRLAQSHIRFGHFEHFFANKRPDLIKVLADHVIDFYFTGISYTDWFSEIVKRTASLIADWQSVGFAHGVMNTDNMSILGLTLDYGPFGFVESYDPHFICNHSDTHGRYAFDQQPAIALWNLQILAYVLQSLVPAKTSLEILEDYKTVYNQAYHQRMTAKLGICFARPSDYNIYDSLLQFMQQQGVDYTRTFHSLSDAVAKQDKNLFLTLFSNIAPMNSWFDHLQQRLGQEPPGASNRMRAVNPKYILRNWVAETAIRQAEDQGDYQLIDRLSTMLNDPYHDHPDMVYFAENAPEPLKNLCVSCSS